jgi:phage terminase small subunit
VTRREQRFVHHYLVCADATEAARRTGYSEATAQTTGPRLLAKPIIRAAIAKMQTEQMVRTGITMERVLREYVRVALADLGRVIAWGPAGVRVKPLKDWSDDDAAAIGAIAFTDDKGGQRVRLELHDKKFALSVLETYFNVGEKPPDPTGARDRLLAKLEWMAKKQDRANLIEQLQAEARAKVGDNWPKVWEMIEADPRYPKDELPPPPDYRG